MLKILLSSVAAISMVAAASAYADSPDGDGQVQQRGQYPPPQGQYEDPGDGGYYDDGGYDQGQYDGPVYQQNIQNDIYVIQGGLPPGFECVACFVREFGGYAEVIAQGQGGYGFYSLWSGAAGPNYAYLIEAVNQIKWNSENTPVKLCVNLPYLPVPRLYAQPLPPIAVPFPGGGFYPARPGFRPPMAPGWGRPVVRPRPGVVRPAPGFPRPHVPRRPGAFNNGY